MTTRKVCPLCRSGYRDWNAHQGTERHRKIAFRVSNPLGPRKGPRREARGRGARRAKVADVGQDMIRVKPHRRRRPLDGPRRSVAVRRYWRRRDFDASGRARDAARERRDLADLARKYPDQYRAYMAAVRAARRAAA